MMSIVETHGSVERLLISGLPTIYFLPWSFCRWTCCYSGHLPLIGSQHP